MGRWRLGLMCLMLSTTAATAVPIVMSQQEILALCRRHTVDERTHAPVRPLMDAEEALELRLDLIDGAKRSLDVQYYYWLDDYVGCVVAEHLIAAANRGVKVRILVDSASKAPKVLQSPVIASHANLDIGHFNPILRTDGFFEGAPVPILGEIDRMQCRMHNKLLIADGKWVVGGGRNLGDPYFCLSRKHNMRDADYLGGGSLGPIAERSFEAYWKSSVVRLLSKPKYDQEAFRAEWAALRGRVVKLAKQRDLLTGTCLSGERQPSQQGRLEEGLRTVSVRFIADPPERMLRADSVPSPVSQGVDHWVRGSQSSIIMHAAYFILQDEELELYRQRIADGVRVRVLTNSMASCDTCAAAEGISGRRASALSVGIELYELNVHAKVADEVGRVGHDVKLGMHTKSMVVDDRRAMIGSFNMDPRSRFINTECALFIEDRATAAEVKEYLEIDFRPENSWRTLLNEAKRTRWIGAEQTRRHDPQVGLSRRLSVWLTRLLPWEGVL